MEENRKKIRTPGKEAAFWVLMLGIAALILYLINKEFYYNMETMIPMFCIVGAALLLIAALRYVPKGSAFRVVAGIAGVVLGVGAGLGAAGLVLGREKVDEFYYTTFPGISVRRADEKKIAELARKSLGGEMAPGDVAYGQKLVFAYYDANGGDARENSLEHARMQNSITYDGIPPDRLTGYLDEADTLVVYYTVETYTGDDHWQEQTVSGSAIRAITLPVYGTDTMMYAIDLKTGTASEPVSVAYHMPTDKERKTYSERGYRGRMDREAVFRAVLGDAYQERE